METKVAFSDQGDKIFRSVEEIVGRRIAANMCKMIVQMVDDDAVDFIDTASKGELENTDFDPDTLVNAVKEQLVQRFESIVETHLKDWIEEFSEAL